MTLQLCVMLWHREQLHQDISFQQLDQAHRAQGGENTSGQTITQCSGTLVLPLLFFGNVISFSVSV